MNKREGQRILLMHDPVMQSMTYRSMRRYIAEVAMTNKEMATDPLYHQMMTICRTQDYMRVDHNKVPYHEKMDMLKLFKKYV